MWREKHQLKKEYIQFSLIKLGMDDRWILMVGCHEFSKGIGWLNLRFHFSISKWPYFWCLFQPRQRDHASGTCINFDNYVVHAAESKNVKQ